MEPVAISCNHLRQVKVGVEASSSGCEDCLELGDSWVHLRICMSCGHVGCCDSSKNLHARKHVHSSGHAIVQSFEPGEDWLYCYPDDLLMPAPRKLYRPPGAMIS